MQKLREVKLQFEGGKGLRKKENDREKQRLKT